MIGGHRGVRALSCTRTLRARGMIHLGRTVGAGGQGGNLPKHTGDKQQAAALYCHQLCDLFAVNFWAYYTPKES